MYYRVIAFSSLVLISIFTQAASTQADIGSKLSSDIIQRYQPTINAIAGNGWDHANSVVLHGMQKIYEKNANPVLLNYIQACK